jgi:hypothetical protein
VQEASQGQLTKSSFSLCSSKWIFLKRNFAYYYIIYNTPFETVCQGKIKQNNIEIVKKYLSFVQYAHKTTLVFGQHADISRFGNFIIAVFYSSLGSLFSFSLTIGGE